MALDPVDLIAESAAKDAEIQARMVKLANRALDEVENLLAWGDPRIKMQIIGKFTTILARRMDARQVDEELEELKKAVGEIRKMMVEGVHIPGVTDVGDNGDGQDVEVDRASD